MLLIEFVYYNWLKKADDLATWGHKYEKKLYENCCYFVGDFNI